MIKTMLLTAQLALSPIVGTNGLQPKRLPNPVYGEEVNLSVTYNGETYTRLAYVDNNTEWKVDWAEQTTLNLRKNGLQLSGNGWLTTNTGTGDSSDYFTYYYDETGPNIDDMSGTNICFAFYTNVYNGETKITTYYYYEVFANKDWLVISNVYKWTNQSAWTFLEKVEGQKPNYIGLQLSNKPTDNLSICTIGNIPQYQPTIANPSIYDNIYNFYYENLFANGALDELGAKVGNNSMSMRQWLAHTATIVSISLLASALVILVIKIFKLIAGSISDIWG